MLRGKIVQIMTGGAVFSIKVIGTIKVSTFLWHASTKKYSHGCSNRKLQGFELIYKACSFIIPLQTCEAHPKSYSYQGDGSLKCN